MLARLHFSLGSSAVVEAFCLQNRFLVQRSTYGAG